ncbi:hypothetical protein AMTR_s00012p00239560 [Amborella trichopoda]|uniref:Uncharacterized protein n=2 Tax=Amborella trichopoda TaxID=13333 RepID=W1PJT0_AMBTC|nr:hypothetical protein AMTR_s00012p00239560 [Amborella trichopoda]
MDPDLINFSNILSGFKVDGSLANENVMDLPLLSPEPHVTSQSISSVDGESPEDSEFFSDIVLNYISDMLMEENIEEKPCMYQEGLSFQATVKPFYDILGEKYPPSPDQPPLYPDLESPEYASANTEENSNSDTRIRSVTSEDATNSIWDSPDYFHSDNSLKTHLPLRLPVDCNSQVSFTSSSSGSSGTRDGLDESPIYNITVPEVPNETHRFWQVNRGVEDVKKLLPKGGSLVFGPESNGFGFYASNVNIKVENEENDYRKKEERDDNKRRQKNPHNRDDLGLEEGRSNKQSAIYLERDVRSETFDNVLLCGGGKGRPFSLFQEEALHDGVAKLTLNGTPKGSNSSKSRSKKQSNKKEVVDLRSLLIHCAEAVATDDRRSINELLKQIRQHSTPYGDGCQRLAQCFADGLEARLYGTGSQIFHATSIFNKRTTAADVLKAYHLYVAACPFKKISHYFANQTIMDVAENASSLHIVDFGIFYGFQWPCLIQRLSTRPGGPPRLRITGIDFPLPGFRPQERVDETGKRLADYAKSFNVPFQYNSIACKWENIRIEDLKLDKDDVLVVNCLFRLRNLVDETVVVDSPRNIMLNTIRKMNPNVFIHATINGAYSAPFFVTRFREAFFHYSALFDMLEANVAREHPQRILIEREIFGKEILNVIACEGVERVERPETYKQWQVRTQRAGFVQLRLNREIVKRARDRVQMHYHKDYVVDEDGQWMLLGWKGRIIHALSTWRPHAREMY